MIAAEEYKYIVWGEEICPDTKKMHWQGYIEFHNARSMAATKKAFGDNAMHLERRRGTQAQAITYCKKDGKWEEFGEKGCQGKRNDIKDLVDRLQERESLEDIMMEDPMIYCKYRGGLKDIAATVMKKRSTDFRKLDVQVYWGAAGAGKTRMAVEENAEHYKINPGNDRLWFDGYEGQECLIIDEFYGQIPYPTLLAILDGYQLRLEIKGGFTYALWTKVILTSNVPPERWYPGGLTPALARRITGVREFCTEETAQKYPW